jgi:hypothetical protein
MSAREGMNGKLAMPLQILFVSFKFDIPLDEYVQAIKPLVNDILNAPGLRWKIWLINDIECMAGGIYLFDDPPSVQAFLLSPLMDRLQHHPAFSSFHIMPFTPLETETALTHGPIRKGVRV